MIKIKKSYKNQVGSSLIEYVLLVSSIALIAVVSISHFGNSLEESINSAKNNMACPDGTITTLPGDLSPLCCRIEPAGTFCSPI